MPTHTHTGTAAAPWNVSSGIDSRHRKHTGSRSSRSTASSWIVSRMTASRLTAWQCPHGRCRSENKGPCLMNCMMRPARVRRLFVELVHRSNSTLARQRLGECSARAVVYGLHNRHLHVRFSIGRPACFQGCRVPGAVHHKRIAISDAAERERRLRPPSANLDFKQVPV